MRISLKLVNNLYDLLALISNISVSLGLDSINQPLSDPTCRLSDPLDIISAPCHDHHQHFKPLDVAPVNHVTQGIHYGWPHHPLVLWLITEEGGKQGKQGGGELIIRYAGTAGVVEGEEGGCEVGREMRVREETVLWGRSVVEEGT